MLPFLNKNKIIGLIDKQTGSVKVVDKMNVLLTPSYYWIKRSFLEVKLSSSALKYAPSIFEGMLPEGDYAYYVVKEKNEFVFFAYKPDEIISSLKEKGINGSDIAGIYLAENEMKGITSPILCNPDEVLVLENNTILQVKKYLVNEESIKRDLDDVKQLSKHKITLHKSSVTHSVKELKPLIAVLSVLILLYATQMFFTYSQKQELDNKPSVFQEYKLPNTFVQNSSIEKKLRKSFKAQKSFRKLVFAILKLPLSQRQRITSLIYQKESFRIIFEAEDYARLRDVGLHLKKSLGQLVSIEINKNIMKVKIK
ncbi:hypothetical protein JHD50_00025 [Sulfurimonas sp. MAG313]|nr:hypothetical protein [Sulfurimonas sp. MAG313]MDF1879701.1 hypothetical protein [Sulfurimonas sp. MAG313]